MTSDATVLTRTDGMSMGDALTYQAGRDPDRTAIIAPEGTVTRGELEARANRAARAFTGATPQPVSYRLPDVERTAIMELAAPALVVGVDAGSGKVRRSALRDSRLPRS